MARDGNSYTEGSKTRDRNALLSAAFAMAHESMAQRGAVAAGFFNPIPNADPDPTLTRTRTRTLTPTLARWRPSS